MGSRNARMTVVTVGPTPTVILSIREERTHFYLEHLSGAGITLGPDTDSMLKPLSVPGDNFAEAGYTGVIYGETAGDFAQIIAWEVDR